MIDKFSRTDTMTCYSSCFSSQVDVYRLVTLGTIEEKIQQLQESKKELVNTVLEGQESKNNLTVEDIKEILGVHFSEYYRGRL